MGLYESLDVLVGAGLIACAPALGCPMPPGAARDGARLSGILRERGEADAIGAVLDALAREIWLSQESKGLSMAEAEGQALALTMALDACRPDGDLLRAALGHPVSGVGAKANGAQSIEERIAADVIGRAVRGGHLAADERTRDIAGFLLERMLAHLLTDRGLLPSLVPAFKVFSGDRGGAAHELVAGAGSHSPPPPRGFGAQGGVQRISVLAPPPHRPSASGQQGADPDNRGAPPTPALIPQAGDGMPEVPSAESSDQLRRLRQRHGLSQPAAARLVALSGDKVGIGDSLERAEELAQWIAAARAHLLKPSNEPVEIQRLNAEVAAALAEADFETARALLDRVRGSVREARRRSEARLKDELASLQQRQTEEAEATAGLAELALARHEYDRAAELFQEAADGLPASDSAGALRYLLRQAEALYRKGRKSPETPALRQSAQIFTRALQQARTAGEQRSAALAELGVGKVLIAEAERGGDPAIPADAVGALRRALTVLTRDAEPALWIDAQMELGAALALEGLALPEPVGLERLQEAAAAYQATLMALSREAAPLRWALIQVRLGGVLVRSGERSNQARFWLAAATALFNALDVFEAEGATQHAEMTRLSLRQFQDRLPAALGQPSS